VLLLTDICDEQPGDWGPRRISREDIEATFSGEWIVENLQTCIREINRPEIQAWTAKAWLATIRHVGPLTHLAATT
jgi:hypothetical protein